MAGFTQDALRLLGLHYGLSAAEVHRALAWAKAAKEASAARAALNVKIAARHPAPARSQRPTVAVSPDKAWCLQCERRASAVDAARCESRWCKVKAIAANPTREEAARQQGVL